MRILASLLKASIVAASVFAVAWIRIPGIVSSLETAIGVFIVYGVLIVIVSLMIGFPLASLAEKYRLVHWWLSSTVGAAAGALLAATFTYRELDAPIGNPFALSFSPWNRDAPGIIDNIPFSQTDFAGSVAFGAVIGGVLGLAFWHFYSHGTHRSSTV